MPPGFYIPRCQHCSFLSQELYLVSPVQQVSLSLKLLKFIVSSQMLALNISRDPYTEDDGIKLEN